MYKTLKPLATGLVKRQVQKAIHDAVRTGLEYLDEQLVVVRDKYNEAKQSDETSRREAIASLFERKKDDVASSSSSFSEGTKKKDTAQFKIVGKRESTIIPDAGWTQKINEREQVAASGEGWRSDAFSVISSLYTPTETKESAGIPGVPRSGDTGADVTR